MRKSVLFVVLVSAAAPLFAVDGQVLINQSTLNAAGGTYTITQPGSYKLSGNLQQKDPNTDVIVIASSNVTIDLNGFSILGTTDCSTFPCKNGGNGVTGWGIKTFGLGTSYQNFFTVTVRNGTIQGLGGSAVTLIGDSILVEYMQIRSNKLDGINLSCSNCIVQHNNVDRNGGAGIAAGGAVRDNVITNNAGFGVGLGFPASVARNVILNNGSYSIVFTPGSNGNYIGNVMSGNLLGDVPFGGVNQGQNFCGSSACPGAVF